MDDQTPAECWADRTEFLRDNPQPHAQAGAWLMDQGAAKWASVVVARTSHYDLLFTRVGDEYPFPLSVRVKWRDDVYEFTLHDRDGYFLRSGDRCFAATAPAVLDAFLYQLAGDASPEFPAPSRQTESPPPVTRPRG